MKKLDLKKELKQFYRPSAKQVEAVDVPELRFLMINGFLIMDHGSHSKAPIDCIMSSFHHYKAILCYVLAE